MALLVTTLLSRTQYTLPADRTTQAEQHES